MLTVYDNLLRMKLSVIVANRKCFDLTHKLLSPIVELGNMCIA